MQSAQAVRRLLLIVVFTGSVGLETNAAAQSPASPSTTWEGSWMNRKYNTQGPLKCTAVKHEGDQAGTLMKATFTGLFMGEGFKYDVEFRAAPSGARQRLQGVATLDGDRYQWTGYAQGNTMVGEFQSLKGNHGAFKLQRVNDAGTAR